MGLRRASMDANAIASALPTAPSLPILRVQVILILAPPLLPTDDDGL